MNKRWAEMILALLFGLGIPAILISVISSNSNVNSTDTSPMESTEAIIATTEETQVKNQHKIHLLMDDNSIQDLEIEQYIISVVLQEMPADFEMEALKAQAVVARTYAMRRQAIGNKHEGASVCTNPSCCQGYCSIEQYLNNGGTQDEVDKITQAVTATTGEVLTYNGELVEATYFSCSGGMTEDAAAVWGTDIPYLQSTESPGEEQATHYTDTVSFASEKFSQLLGFTLSGKPESWFQDITYTDGGGVENIWICGEKFTGIELRKLLGLRSTCFTIAAVGDVISITTKGFGHRVGMSQYGADAMAVQGKTYADILAHYYCGTSLSGY